MIKIDETQLKLLFEKRRKLLERSKHDGVGEIISGISLIIALALADYSQLTFIKPHYFKIISWGVSFVILGFGLYSLYKNYKQSYTLDTLYNEIANLDSEAEHPYSIVIIENSLQKGKYLVRRSARWNCWLFPHYYWIDRSVVVDSEINNLRAYIKRDFDLLDDLAFKYLGDMYNRKQSAGDKISKKYHYYFFKALFSIDMYEKKHTFYSAGKKYTWMTLEKMFLDKNIMEKNKDVLDYIRHRSDIS